MKDKPTENDLPLKNKLLLSLVGIITCAFATGVVYAGTGNIVATPATEITAISFILMMFKIWGG